MGRRWRMAGVPGAITCRRAFAPIVVPVTGEHTTWADGVRVLRDAEHGKSGESLGRTGARNAGHLAELMFATWCRQHGVEHFWLYEAEPGMHDFDLGPGFRVEMKTRYSNTPPRVDWTSHVGCGAMKKQFDYLLFASYDERGGAMHFIGFADKDEYLRRAVLVNPGEPMPQTGIIAKGPPSWFAVGHDWMYPVPDFVQAIGAMPC